jgi:single-stranded-DNA-specific exonuclease
MDTYPFSMAFSKNYRLKEAVPQDVSDAFIDLSPLAKQLLWNRGLTSKEEVDTFLTPSYDTHLHDPFLMTDMDVAVSRVLLAIKNNERIAIYSDYDCDGIPGAVALHDFFTAIGFTNFENYIPDRHYEGFGVSLRAIDALKASGVSLMITIDCGTASVEAVEAANQAGIDVIITDHHEPGATLPQALALLNPKRDDAYPFKGLCGAGVVYKLIQAIIKNGKEQAVFEFSEGQEKWLLDMVGLATIADMVPLHGENRVLAFYGLQVLRKSRRPGLQHLLRKARAEQRYLTEDDIGFTIGPRINAASRMDTPMDAFHMLATKDEVDAGARVMRLESLNNERKGIVAAMSKELKKRIEMLEELPRVIVLGNPEWKPALVGLAANSLVETYERPVFLWGRDGNGIIKGSCRGDGRASVIALMEGARDAFIEFGGHHGSGGFSVADENIHTIADMLNRAYEKLGEKILVANEQYVDANIALSDIDSVLLKTLRSLAPFGEGNPKPLFKLSNVVPEAVEIFGKAKEHMKLVFKTEKGYLDAIAFFTQPQNFALVPERGKECTLIAHVEESFFMNRMQVRLRIVDIV